MSTLVESMNITHHTAENPLLHELLTPATIKLRMTGKTKQEIIDELIGMADDAGLLLDRFAVRDAIIERERIVSTGLENGLAVPHGKTSGVDRLVGVLGIKPEGIPFDAADGHPSKIFFMLVSPMSVSGPHVRALGRIAKFLRDETRRTRLLKAETADEVWRYFKEEQ